MVANGRPSSTAAAAAVIAYMLKVEGSRAVEAANRPAAEHRKSRRQRATAGRQRAATARYSHASVAAEARPRQARRQKKPSSLAARDGGGWQAAYEWGAGEPRMTNSTHSVERPAPLQPPAAVALRLTAGAAQQCAGGGCRRVQQ